MIPVSHSMRDKSKGRIVNLVKYVSSDKGNPARIGEIMITNCSSPDPFIASKEMEAVQCLNTRSEDDKTYHLTVSFPNGERPDSATIRHIEEKIAEALGYGAYQRVSIVHNDTDNMHLHMVVNKIHPEKNTIRTVKNDHGVLAKVCAGLEQELALAADNHEAKRGHQEGKIDSLEHKRGTETFAAYARKHATAALAASSTWGELQDRLASAGIEAKLHGNGIVFACSSGEHAVKGSSVGRDFSKGNLEKRFGTFELHGQETQPEAREKLQPLKFHDRYQEKPKYGDKSLYEEYQEDQARINLAKEAQLASLHKERAEAIAKAKREAAAVVEAQTLANLVRSKRLVSILKKQATQKRLGPVLAEFKARRQEIMLRAKRKGYVDWLKEQAQAGNVRAIFTLRGKGEVAPDLISISSRDLSNAKTIAAKIEGVTGRGTLFYAAGKDVFRDDGINLSLRTGVTDEGIKKALIIARAKFNNSPLTLEGTDEFLRRCAEISKREKLDITFANPAIEAIRRGEQKGRSVIKEDKRQGRTL